MSDNEQTTSDDVTQSHPAHNHVTHGHPPHNHPPQSSPHPTSQIQGAPLPADAERALILQVLSSAATAHGVHEETELGGVYDVEWPAWYTDHMHRELSAQGYRIVKVG